MRAPATTILWLILLVPVYPAFGSSSHKCKHAACDINAIGHRKLFASNLNWFSAEKEREMGDKLSAALLQQVEILRDDPVTTYVDRVVKQIAQNSDADIPIAVRIIRRSDVSAFILPGGHLYLTTGLILRLKSEGELASIVARGVAHTALHTVAREQTRASLLQMTSVPFVVLGQDQAYARSGLSFGFGILKFAQEFESQADYFGIQYVYKASYDTDCFLNAIQNVWRPDPNKSGFAGLDPFLPLTERMKALRKEIDDYLPARPGAVVSTPEFDQFIGRLQQIVPQESVPQNDARPKLIRHDDLEEDE
jgi:beta-barrel assembly-enhancing protease